MTRQQGSSHHKKKTRELNNPQRSLRKVPLEAHATKSGMILNGKKTAIQNTYVYSTSSIVFYRPFHPSDQLHLPPDSSSFPLASHCAASEQIDISPASWWMSLLLRVLLSCVPMCPTCVLWFVTSTSWLFFRCLSSCAPCRKLVCPLLFAAAISCNTEFLWFFPLSLPLTTWTISANVVRLVQLIPSNQICTVRTQSLPLQGGARSSFQLMLPF